MAKNKQVRIGRVVKHKIPATEDRYVLSLKQNGKLSGQQSRELKAAIEKVVETYLSTLYAPDSSKN